MFVINYRAPYTGQLRFQKFATLKEAQSMIAFYESCGSTAWLA